MIIETSRQKNETSIVKMLVFDERFLCVYLLMRPSAWPSGLERVEEINTTHLVAF